MRRLPVYILAGGRSRRFGRDKARAKIAGRALILQAADALRPVASRLTIVADVPGKYHDLSMNTIGDRRPGLGPLGGLHAALCDQREHHGEGWVVLSACDLIDLKVEWITRLIDHVDTQLEAIAFRGERWEPLPAVYHTSLSRSLRQCVDAGHRALWQLLTHARSLALPLPDDWSSLSHFNTPHDLRAYGGGVK